jgi:hypothetical protein
MFTSWSSGEGISAILKISFCRAQLTLFQEISKEQKILVFDAGRTEIDPHPSHRVAYQSDWFELGASLEMIELQETNFLS